MIRGTQREMIMLKGDSKSAFETVFFLIRTDAPATRGAREDMLAEANRIIAQNRPTRKRRGAIFWQGVKRRIPAFLLGALCGAASAIALWVTLT